MRALGRAYGELAWRRPFLVSRCRFALRKGPEEAITPHYFLLFNRRIRALCGAPFFEFQSLAYFLSASQWTVQKEIILLLQFVPLRGALFFIFWGIFQSLFSEKTTVTTDYFVKSLKKYFPGNFTFSLLLIEKNNANSLGILKLQSFFYKKNVFSQLFSVFVSLKHFCFTFLRAQLQRGIWLCNSLISQSSTL